jgi:hypothetical protein
MRNPSGQLTENLNATHVTVMSADSSQKTCTPAAVTGSRPPA